MPQDGQMDRQLEGLDRLVRARWIISPFIAALVVAVTATLGGNLERLTKPLIIVLCLLGYNLLLHLTLPRLRSKLDMSIHGWLQVLLDLVAITALIYYSGSRPSPFFLLYLIEIIGTGFVLPPGGLYLFASLASLAYGLLLMGEYTGLIAPVYDLYSNVKLITPDSQAMWARYFIPVAMLLYLGAFLTDRLVKQIRASERRARQQLAEMTTLFNAITAMASSLEPGDVLHRIAEQMTLALDASSCYVLDWNVLSKTWTVQAEYVSSQMADKEHVSGLGTTFREDEFPLTAVSLRSLQPVLIRMGDPLPDAIHRTYPVAYSGATTLLLPLVIRDEAFGCVQVWDRRREREFTSGEIRLAQMFASQAAIAIENARLYQAEREQRELAETLQEVGATLVATLNVDTVLDRLLEQVSRVVPNDVANVMLIEHNRVRIARGRGYERFGIEAFMTPFADPVTSIPNLGKMAETGQPILVPDTRADPNWIRRSEEDWLLSYAGAPICARGQVIGFLNVGSATPDFFGQSHITRLNAFAGQAAIALENARLYAAEQTRARRAEAVARIGRVLGANLDLDATLPAVAQEIARAMDVPQCGIVLFDEEARYGRVMAEYQQEPDDTATRVRIPMADNPFLQHMLQTGEPLAIYDAAHDPLTITIRDVVALRRIRSILLAPLLVGGRIIGTIGFDSIGQPRHFTSEEQELAQTLANQVAAAIENARLYAQVRAEQEELRAVLESTGDAVIVTDPQGAIALFNLAAEHTFDVAAKQVFGRPLPEAVPALAEPMREALDSPAAQAHHCEVTLPNKQTLVCNLEPVREADGALRGWVGVLHDVTHFKELDRVKSELIGTVSHDLRNPLHLTRNYFEVLVEALGPLTPDKQSMVSAVRRALHRMEALITDLLNLEKIEASMGLSREQCDLGLLLADALTDIQAAAFEKGVTLGAEMPLIMPLVWCDPQWLTQVFQNLLDNAIKYTRPGDAVNVHVRVENATVTVCVADTGPGIPPDDLPHIFDRFYRVRRQPLSPVKGTGLGLAIVKSIVEQHGGRVWAESQVGRGSTFCVALPVAPAPETTTVPG